jgi:glycosyltransferase involved in cell wall biosynthesis
MKIGIIGTRGIPNRYGGFEQLAEKLSVGLVNKGHEVIVYNSKQHPYQQKNFNAVKIIHCYDAEHWLGTTGQFIYDLNCIVNARRENFDALLFLGYTSSSVFGRFFPKRPLIISNMDGMEWKRSKYSKLTQRFLKQAEKWAIKYSDFFIADSPVIQTYLQAKYAIDSEYIAYGADILQIENEAILDRYKLTKYEYYMLMARMEPENNIEMILDGFYNSNSTKRFIVVGNADNKFGTKLKEKYKNDTRIILAGSEFDQNKIHTLKFFCSLYFHGHSVGGTNPSLLEAMASKANIAAHNNDFNRAVLQDDAQYFADETEVRQIIGNTIIDRKAADNNFSKITEQYNWHRIIDQYEDFITKCVANKK